MTGDRPAVEVQPAPRYHPLEVADAWMVTPNFRRVRLAGPMVASLAEEAPAAWIKLYPYENGTPAKVGRAYTIRSVSPTRDHVDLDILIDHDGPLSRWGRGAKAADRIFAAGPGRGIRAPAESSRHLLIGDATAVPAILAIIEKLPAGRRVSAIIAVDGEAECQSVETAADLSLHWLLPDGTGSMGERLLAEVRGLSVDGSSFVWTAADVETVSAIRRHCLQSLLHPRSLFHGAGYWKKGETGFNDLSGDWT